MKKLLMAIMASSPVLLNAGMVIDDDQIVQGNSCLGHDCVNDEAFTQPGQLRLKENNLRIRFYPDSEFSGIGKQWLIEANDEKRTGINYFKFQALDPEQQTLQFSDGFEPMILCDTWTTSIGLYPEQMIPYGEPILEIVSQEQMLGYLPNCETQDDQLSDGTTPNPVCNKVYVNQPASPEFEGTIPAGEPQVVVNGFTRDYWYKASCQQKVATASVDRIFLPINDQQSIGLTGSKQEKPFTVAAGSEAVLQQLKNIQQSLQATDLLTLSELEQWKASVHEQLDQVEAFLDARDLIYAYLTDPQQKAPEIEDYQAIGIAGLYTGGMIDFINQQLTNSKLDPKQDKLVDVRAEVDAARQAYLDSQKSGGGAMGGLLLSLLLLAGFRRR